MKRRGRGIACMWYPIGFTVAANPSAAVVKVNEDGTATVLTGTVETGQGSLTVLGQIAAEALGIATDDVHVVSADTDTTPMDTGAIASRTTYVTGNAVRLAAEKAQGDPVPGRGAHARRQAGTTRGARPQDPGQELSAAPSASAKSPPGAVRDGPAGDRQCLVESADRRAWIRKPGRASRSRPTSTPRRSPKSTSTTKPAKSRCCASSPRTIAARAINPMLVEGQVEGGISMGVGFALQEEMLFDANGRQINPNLTNYIMPTSLDMPEIEVDIVKNFDPTGPFGAKGVGEPTAVPTAAAIMNAIYNAVGVRITSLPATPEKVLAAIKAARAKQLAKPKKAAKRIAAH